MKTVVIANSYTVSADVLWKLSVNYSALGMIAGRTISFRGLPPGEFTQGQSVRVSIALLGLFPRQEYHIDILERDDQRRTIRSSERGGGVNAWRHTLVVREAPGGSLLIDTVEIEAGWLTIPAALWAKFIYRQRHWPRIRFLQRDSISGR